MSSFSTRIGGSMSHRASAGARGLSIACVLGAIAIGASVGTGGGLPTLPASSTAVTLAAPGATGTLGLSVSSASNAAANLKPATASDPPPPLPGGWSALTGLTNAQADLGVQIGALQWTAPASVVAVNLNAVDALDNTHVWVAGDTCTLLFSANGTSFTQDTHVPGGCTAKLTGISVADPSHGWAVSSTGTVLVCNAACNTATAVWTAVTGAGFSAVSFTGVWGVGNTVYAVGSVAGPGGAIWGCSANCNSATAGSGAGKSSWANVTPASFSAIPLTAVNGVLAGANATVLAVGSGGAVAVCATSFCTSGGWTKLTAGAGGHVPSTSLTGVSVADPNHAYAVGTGVIWACSNKCNVAVAGTAGSNSTWSNVTPAALGTTALAAVSGVGPNTAWAVGAGGAIWYCPSSCTAGGTFWVSTPGPTTKNLAGVSAADPNHAWAVGALGTILADTTNTPTISALASAIGDLGAARVPSLWTNPDGNHIDSVNGTQVFDHSKSAAKTLAGINPPPSTDINYIDAATRQIATTAISDNSCSAQKPAELNTAQNELNNGDSEYSKGHFDGAADHYGKAWQHALAAKGSSCVGLSVSPSGPLFSVTGMVPKDVDTATPTVTVTGSSGTVTLSGSAYSSSTCSGCPSGVGDAVNFVDHLQLNIVDLTTGKVLYATGPLDGFGSAPVCGTSAGTCPAWNAGESHSIKFTVTFPNGGSADNHYQGTGAKATFTWTRS